MHQQYTTIIKDAK